MAILELNHIKKIWQAELIFEIDRLLVQPQDRIGLVGANGSGKSTLLRMIMGMDTDYQGRIDLRVPVDYLPQMQAPSPQSGGEATITALQPLFAQPKSLLILDEPTANLDLDHKNCLIQQVKDYPGAVLMVSHDRDFLDQMVDWIWAIEQRRLSVYKGNYTDYLSFQRSERAKKWQDYYQYQDRLQRLQASAQKRLDRAQSFKKKKASISWSDYKVNNFAGKYDAQEKAMAKSAKALERRMNRLEKVDKPAKEKRYTLKALGHLSDPSNTLIHLQDVDVQVDDRLLFHLQHFKLQKGDKVGLLGPNKAGKTTFLKGMVSRSLPGYYYDQLSVGYFSQNFDQLDLNQSILENVTQDSVQSMTLIRNLLAGLGFNIDKLDQRISTLSGGEQVRLSLAKVLLADHHLLFLDEPTNYLDLPTLQELEAFLQEYPGTFVLVSHDQQFIKECVNRRYYIKDQQLLNEQQDTDYSDRSQQTLSLLQFKLQEAISNPEVSLTEIRQLQDQIQDLKENIKHKN